MSRLWDLHRSSLQQKTRSRARRRACEPFLINRLRETVSSRWDLFMRKPPNFLLGGACPFLLYYAALVSICNKDKSSTG